MTDKAKCCDTCENCECAKDDSCCDGVCSCCKTDGESMTREDLLAKKEKLEGKLAWVTEELEKLEK